MLNAFLGIVLVVAAVSIPLALYWKAEEVIEYLRRHDA
jgi:hypothetical protein